MPVGVAIQVPLNAHGSRSAWCPRRAPTESGVRCSVLQPICRPGSSSFGNAEVPRMPETQIRRLFGRRQKKGGMSSVGATKRLHPNELRVVFRQTSREPSAQKDWGASPGAGSLSTGFLPGRWCRARPPVSHPAVFVISGHGRGCARPFSEETPLKGSACHWCIVAPRFGSSNPRLPLRPFRSSAAAVLRTPERQEPGRIPK